MRVLIDGREVAEGSAQVSVFDWGVQRGFGCFEVIGSYEGRPFRLGPHLERLNRSAAALRIDLAPLEDIADWVRAVAASGGDCQVRVLVTGGGRDELFDTPSRTVVLWEPKPHVPDLLRLLPTVATWHPATDRGFAGVKWLSYAPNMASTDAARRAGFDDALLLSTDALVLEDRPSRWPGSPKACWRHRRWVLGSSRRSLETCCSRQPGGWRLLFTKVGIRWSD